MERAKLYAEIMRDARRLVESFERHYPEAGLEFLFSGTLLLVFRDHELVFTWYPYEGLCTLVEFLKANK